jgi:hypothetical protein
MSKVCCWRKGIFSRVLFCYLKEYLVSIIPLFIFQIMYLCVFCFRKPKRAHSLISVPVDCSNIFCTKKIFFSLDFQFQLFVRIFGFILFCFVYQQLKKIILKAFCFNWKSTKKGLLTRLALSSSSLYLSLSLPNLLL